jgi:hypothetical protein
LQNPYWIRLQLAFLASTKVFGTGFPSQASWFQFEEGPSTALIAFDNAPAIVLAPSTLGIASPVPKA